MILIRLTIVFVLFITLFTSNLSFIKEKFFSSANFADQVSKLEMERDSLKAQLFINENLNPQEVKSNSWEYLSAKVFSSYPFNNQSLISINIGENSGLNISQSVVFAPGLLLGQVIKTNKDSALIRTIFDKDFTAAIKIGNSNISGLLKGGFPPTLEMITKNKDIKNGDIVYNSDKNFPYGFKFGEVQLISSQDSAEPFKKAYLKVNYGISSLEEVLIVKNFEPIKND